MNHISMTITISSLCLQTYSCQCYQNTDDSMHFPSWFFLLDHRSTSFWPNRYHPLRFLCRVHQVTPLSIWGRWVWSLWVWWRLSIGFRWEFPWFGRSWRSDRFRSLHRREFSCVRFQRKCIPQTRYQQLGSKLQFQAGLQAHDTIE